MIKNLKVLDNRPNYVRVSALMLAQPEGEWVEQHVSGNTLVHAIRGASAWSRKFSTPEVRAAWAADLEDIRRYGSE